MQPRWTAMAFPIPLITLAAIVGEAPLPIAEMRWQHRVLLVSAPRADDVELARQRRIFAAMQAAAGERDLVLVMVIGNSVAGAGDTASVLRRRHRLPEEAFAAVLIGKDGGEKFRAGKAVPAGELAAVIDAMPMRRGGER